MIRLLRRSLRLVWWHTSETLLWIFGRRSSYAVLKLEVSGDLAEVPSLPPLPFLRSRARTDFLRLLTVLRWASQDTDVQAVFIKCGELQVGWAKLQELHRCLLTLRKHGKRVHVHLTQANLHEYVLSSAADKITLAPAGNLDITGISSEVVFIAGVLDKLGIQPELVQFGKYKSAGETFTRTTMSPEHREMVEGLLGDLYEQVAACIAEGRGISPEKARAVLNEGPYSARQACEAGLVDSLAYEDEAEAGLRAGLEEAGVIEQGPYATRRGKQLRRLGLFETIGRIGLLHVSGPIKTGETVPGGDGASASGAGSLMRDLTELRERDDIEAVVVRVASPGGSGLASDLLWHEMQRIKSRKPLVVSMGDVAASGGYYIGVAGCPVLAENGTITGSIGVLAGKPVLRKFYEKLGVTKEIVSHGRHAALHTDYLPLSDDDRKVLHGHAEQFYSEFLDKVAAGRSLPTEQVHEAAQGRVWTGKQAMGFGLIDQIGGLEQALAEAKLLAGHLPETRVAIETYPKPRRIWRLPLPFGLPLTQLSLTEPWWREAARERLWAILPFRLRFF